MNVFKLRREKGFTLVELLVVIAIIGVLATLVLLQLGTARARARDTKRISDVSQLRTAVEQFFEDNGGKYPTAISQALLGKYIKVPLDPLSNLGYGYCYNGTTSYRIMAKLEQTAAALNGDSDINSTGWTLGAGGDPLLTCAAPVIDSDCSTVPADCIYDQGIQ